MRILRILCLVISVFFSATVVSQEYNINDYKYIIVPESYSFLTKNDAYQLNSLTRFLFKKNGFKAFNIAEGFPEDLKKNGCKALRVDLIKNSDFFYTKLSIKLTDCNGKVVFVSSEGKSKEKEFKKTYQEALRNAFKDISIQSYSYNGKYENSPAVDVNSIPDIGADVVKAKAVDVTQTKTYVFNNENYIFKKKDYGFEIAKGLVSIGKLFKVTRDNTYILQAEGLSGYGYFDVDLNFVVERVDPDTNKLIRSLFTVKN